jgi:peptidyl-prolyl cis-trans isomerase B (cyclophilin B)
LSGAVCLALAGCSKSSEGAGEQAPATAASKPAEEKAPEKDTQALTLHHSVDQLDPVVVLHTSVGDIMVKLNAQKAPLTVYNFMNYCAKGHYDGTIFHQVEDGFAILGGGYTPELTERTGRYPVTNEAANGLKNKRNTIAMARDLSVIDSATCQFVINLVDNPSLDHTGQEPEKYGYCVFGEVVEGFDVLEKIAKTPVADKPPFTKLPVETVSIQSVFRVR